MSIQKSEEIATSFFDPLPKIFPKTTTHHMKISEPSHTKVTALKTQRIRT